MASEGKFTAGPWEAKQAFAPTDGAYDWGIGAEIDGQRYCIAEAFGRVGDDVRPNAAANAALIAAAPALYAALTAALTLIDDNADELAALTHPDTVNAICDMGNAAITSAGLPHGA